MQTKIRFGSIVFVFILTICVQAQESMTPGQIIDKVVCKSAPNETYALYLPVNYSPKQQWPILYCYDARENGKFPTELFQEVAEKYGYIIASSNHTRSDDPTWPNLDAMKAVWDDTHNRFQINPKRVYATGFSGGARLAWGLGYIFPGSVAGVIGCSGGYHADKPPSKDTPFIYFGTAGNRDFNYPEMVALDHTLEQLGIPHGLAIFDGTHSWPTKEVATKALEWMDLQAIKTGLKEKNGAEVDSLYEKRAAEVAALHGYAQLKAYEAIVRDFGNLKDISQEQKQIAALKDSPEVKKDKKDEERRERETEEYHKKLRTVLAMFMNNTTIPPSIGDLSQQLEIATLKKKAEKDPNSEDAIAAQRMLENSYVQMAFYLPTAFLNRKDYVRAINALTVATQIKEKNPNTWYNLACAYARSGNKKKAIETLEHSVALGFSDRNLMQTDQDLESIRGEEEFKKVLASLQ